MTVPKRAQNVHRTYITPLAGAEMGSDFTTEIIDWKEMVVGSIQAVWSGND